MSRLWRTSTFEKVSDGPDRRFAPNRSWLHFLESTFPLASLENELAAYVKHPEKQEQAFDINNIPKISRAQAAAEVPRESNL